jgi:hypothetical protein
MKNIILATILVCAATSAHAQDFSANDLARRTIERRAVEAANWGTHPNRPRLKHNPDPFLPG